MGKNKGDLLIDYGLTNDDRHWNWLNLMHVGRAGAELPPELMDKVRRGPKRENRPDG